MRSEKTNAKAFQKIGVLGGGQLGKMLCLAAANWDLDIHILDPNPQCSARPYCTVYTEGDFNDFQTVLAFGRKVDVVTIEIEHVSVEALQQLKKEGKCIYPDADALVQIKDKGLQKLFYQKNKFPTAPFFLAANRWELESLVRDGVIKFPFVWKSRKGGYDGKGVKIVADARQMKELSDLPCLIEEKINFDKEIAVIVGRNPDNEKIAYDPVEMFFDEKANLLSYQICPARIEPAIAKKAVELALSVIEQLDMCGLLAVEMFVDHSGGLLINEVAPRPHNSGHHSIEACETSQFEQHLRCILNLPLGSTSLKSPSVLLNLLGEAGYSGVPYYEGWEDCLKTVGAHIHLYGKKTTQPYRKMGHITIEDQNLDNALAKANNIRSTLKVISL